MKTIDLFIYLKLCWGRANSHLGVFFGLFEKAALASILLKVFGVEAWEKVAIIGFILVVAMFAMGHLDLYHRVLEKETSLSNQYNKEIQELMRK